VAAVAVLGLLALMEGCEAAAVLGMAAADENAGLIVSRTYYHDSSDR
jgi:hypothetical protein